MLGAPTLAQNFTAQVTYATGSGPDAVAVADLNGDGKPDLAVANCTPSKVGVLLGNGDGTFKTQVQYAVGGCPDAVVAGDFNGDGNPDVVAANNGGATVGVLLSVVTQTTTATESGIAVPGSGTHAVSSSYGGATNFSSSASGTVSVTATPVATTLTLTAN